MRDKRRKDEKEETRIESKKWTKWIYKPIIAIIMFFVLEGYSQSAINNTIMPYLQAIGASFIDNGAMQITEANRGLILTALAIHILRYVSLYLLATVCFGLTISWIAEAKETGRFIRKIGKMNLLFVFGYIILDGIRYYINYIFPNIGGTAEYELTWLVIGVVIAMWYTTSGCLLTQRNVVKAFFCFGEIKRRWKFYFGIGIGGIAVTIVLSWIMTIAGEYQWAADLAIATPVIIGYAIFAGRRICKNILNEDKENFESDV